MLTKLALISLGGIGVALRFYIGYGVVSILPSHLHYSFIATFCINMLACFGIGLCVAMIKGQDSLLFVFLTIGLLGGFSTFFYLQPRSAKTPAKSLYPYRNALYATLQCMWNLMRVFRLCVKGQILQRFKILAFHILLQMCFIFAYVSFYLRIFHHIA